MSDDLIKRLREPWCIPEDMLQLMEEAAAALAEAEAELARLQKRLAEMGAKDE